MYYIYLDYSEKEDIADKECIKDKIKLMWDKVSTFKKYKDSVATLHIPMKEELIKNALKDDKFKVNTMEVDTYYYPIN